MHPFPPIICPHCRGTVAYVPHMAGHPATCPHCRGIFQMPPYHVPTAIPLPPPPAPQQPTDPLDFNAGRSSGPKRSKTSRGGDQGGSRTWPAILVATLLLAGGGLKAYSTLTRPTVNGVRTALRELNQDKTDPYSYTVNAAALFGRVGKPSTRQHLDGDHYWYWNCRDGVVQMKLHESGDNIQVWTVNETKE